MRIPWGQALKEWRALQEAAGRIHIYPDSNCYYLKEALAKHLSVAPEQLIIGNGSDEILKMLGEAFLTPEDEVVLSEHTFSVYQFVARLMGAGGGSGAHEGLHLLIWKRWLKL